MKKYAFEIIAWAAVLVSLYFAFYSYGVFAITSILSLVIFWEIRKTSKTANFSIIIGQYLSLGLLLYSFVALFIGLN